MQQRNARWHFRRVRALAVTIGVSALVAAGSALAQGPPQNTGRRVDFSQGPFGFGPRFQGPAPGGPGNILAPYLPPGVQETFPLAPTQQPDILRNLLQMRATSPNPNAFLGGTLNPQYQATGRPHHGYGYGYDYGYYGGYVDPSISYGYDPYGGYAYGGYLLQPSIGVTGLPSVYSTYGGWYPQSLPQDRVVVQREVIYVQPPPRSDSRTEDTSDGYYLSRPKTETLNDAIEDIRKAWLNGDYARFRSRLPGEGKVRIYLKGKYEYSVKSDDFAQMTHDAMDRIDTTGFDLDTVKNLGDGRAFASGKHTYVDPDKNKHEVYVSYGLEREGGRWKIAEAGSSTKPIVKHEE